MMKRGRVAGGKAMSFFQSIQRVFQSGEPPSQDLNVSMAKAMILLEVALFDEEFAPVERACIRKLLKDEYQLSSDEVEQLLRDAAEYRKDNPDIFYSTRKLNQSLTVKQKEEFMVQVWRVVLSDGKLDYSEDVLTRKLVNLLRLDRSTWLKTKREAEKMELNNDIDQ
ncbi:MAG: hypothetical protein CR997_01495 [Acidobacteria bacterium]|nr:MAG: hypothetical protein CR997_01495 [Acidobacteriota bacterium]